MRSTRVAALGLAAVGAMVLAACTAQAPGDEETGGEETGGEETAAADCSGAEGTINIGIKFDQPGLGFRDGNEYTGFDVDVATYVACQLGYAEDQIEWVESPSAQRENMLQTGQVDMIFATYSITDERKEVVAFAGPYFVAGQDLLVRADETDIAGPEDLEGRNLCSVTGSTSAQRIKDEYAEGTNLVEQPGYADCVTVLLAGQVDAVTTDDIILAGLAAQPANQGQLTVVGAPFSEENYGVGIPQDSELCEDINAAIAQMITDGAWEEAVTANTEGTGYTPNADLNPPEQDACA
ncbi:extracellular solute-binding protein family 3 [Beutenbergia cavernae DSM 12333]|uniref:Extracellular solute-binding protein family 3 n=1 Tax=Beutenbergia cavernae (strain ATCC BAA-8 / DSM 12333 / CCUG 43141 / JCM 11478 / NBRC 16432 / NCIMB 13614 / HKI 0122) TaxID=471853 RepID=C5BWM8_BEUC1|nr:glutamate ABC transporter substrate-binding protein [Beutenbergia cavernae]ACQ80694.1 extracellular solute-binding protein family 3 [Beutenbergia cavernae DSM 12333]